MTAKSIRREHIRVRPFDPAVVETLVKELGVSEPFGRILACRNILSREALTRFMQPRLEDFFDPFLFTDMGKAVERIQEAVARREKIVIYGDYDVDGVSATVLLMSVFRNIGAECAYYLPNRLTEGYGMSLAGIDEIHRLGGRLIVSVDCGITAVREVERAASLGIDVIITDHHEPQSDLPRAVAVLDPKVDGCGYPDRNLAGVGVALKLCQALARATGRDDSLWLEHLDLVSIGTAADIVPLTGENRIIVKHGFAQLAQTRNLGIRKLIAQQGLEGKSLSTSDVVFYLAPCINAAGRLGDSTRGVKLLLSEDEGEAALFARELVEMNRERRALDTYVQEEAQRWVEHNVDLQKEYAIVAGKEDWHTGVIGIAASKLVDKFCRPTFLFSCAADGFAKGSGRGVKGLHLLNALKECGDLLEGFGGHEAAAGAHIKVENIPLFRKKFNAAVAAQLCMDDLVPLVHADAEVPFRLLGAQLFRDIQQMQPFGPGNMRPVLVCRELKSRHEPRIVGKNHLKMTVAGDGLVMDAIAFNFAQRFEEIKFAQSMTMAFSLDENTFNGRTTLQMKVKGVET